MVEVVVVVVVVVVVPEPELGVADVVEEPREVP